MGLGKLSKKTSAETVLGIDASTNSIAFCLFSTVPLSWGEVSFKGSNTFERVFDGAPKVRSTFANFTYDAIVIEPIVYVNNRSTVINLAYGMGMIMSSLPPAPVHEYNPLMWQRYINNPPFTKEEKAQLKLDYPDKSATWQKNHMREVRKERTQKWVLDTYGIGTDNENVADAIGIAHTGWHQLNA